ncbi:MAG: DNA alkylation repair protein [Actinomycetia bacterium]|nr:DNA alkylation repair protein [Actinomycetes bacterium]
MPQITIDARAQELLTQAADPAKAGPMAAYMKTEMPFYGVSSHKRKVISRLLATEFPATSRAEYVHAVRTLWHGEFREEKYLAIAYARLFPHYVTLSSIPMYRTMITQGAWWDFIDEIAAHLVGSVLLRQRDRLTPTMESWTMSTDMWLARTSIICQLRHKADTDTEFLDSACTRNLESTEFFIRKAIGWALREFGKTNPAWVIGYVERHQDEMSGLTHREAVKHLR